MIDWDDTLEAVAVLIDGPTPTAPATRRRPAVTVLRIAGYGAVLVGFALVVVALSPILALAVVLMSMRGEP